MSNDESTPSGGHGQNWPAYRAAQLNEKRLFSLLLSELCKDVEEPEHPKGRPPFTLRDMAFAIVIKVYSTFSSWRFIEDLHQARHKNLIKAVPSSNSVSQYMRDEVMTPILQELITKSSLPLTQVEKIFAVDSTGLSLPQKHSWFNRHTGRWERRHNYFKLHVITGVSTNIITAAEVSERTSHDSTHFKRLVEATARYFKISEVSADAAYISSENSRAVLMLGGIPFIAFRKNCTTAGSHSTFLSEMLQMYQSRQEQFMRHYYLRNNVESTFSALQAKFTDRLRSKSPRGQINESLCKALCHNLCVLIQSWYELGIDPTAWTDVPLMPVAHEGAIGRALTDKELDLVSKRIPAAKAIRQAQKGKD